MLVEIFEDGSGTARGSMYHVRNSPNDVEVLGCGTKTFKNNAPRWGFCQAADSDDEYVSCETTKPEMLDQIRAIADYSYVRFDFDENFECTRIDVSTQSFYLPGD